MALSDITLKAKTHKDESGKVRTAPYKLYDELGLFVLVSANGGKWWRFKYRFAGKEKLLALGTYPEVSLADARARRDDARKLLAQKPPVDPGEVKKSQKQAIQAKHENTFEAVSREWAESYFKNKSASHKEKTIRRLEIYVFPWLGNKPTADITAPEVLQVIKRPQNQNKLETAHRALQAVGQVMRYAVQNGKAERDVTSDLRGALPTPEVKHMASFVEPQQVSELLRAIDGFQGTFTVECALRLAPLVFTRPSELRRAKWVDIDLDAGQWSYRVTKTKTDHIVPLSTQAIEILKQLYPLSGHGEFVFMGGHDPKKAMSEAAINAALQRMGYDTQTQITGHGFRAMARTLLHERLGIDPVIIEHQLAHKVPDALGKAYNRTKFLDQRKEMMQTWADYLDELKTGAKVLPFKQA
ncbi:MULTISPECIES: integrase arm-type DNA-binding domain-containing protein [unclassified Methylophilus]|uniref:tyrosine-type recombinase/integrase n=1 Tax=unclassified Methylophilus TaxID=2630143 RepID=UPI00036B65BA|nr:MULTISPECIES: integrase arm-type DNA-binding domain-containing protein [unclassified Methylophilus]